ncbi:ComF family protein [Sulfurirhabdus autotrophica]|uniref:ComF family protein n=2 Tax=Sulfurirhabdus autotrophica TaxID=1706046 RepID=A0A4R3XZJ2_9PROT|nr:ComF family protein [Sulfurirhabdus autotrophica]
MLDTFKNEAYHARMAEIINYSTTLSNFTLKILNNCAKFVQHIMPQNCILCGAGTQNSGLCTACHTHLPHHSTACCPICALPTFNSDICGRCLKKAPAFNNTHAAFTYQFPVDSLIHAFKYGGNLALSELLADYLITATSSQPKPDLIIPMPLHPARQRERGFNQSLEIARIISKKLHIPLAINLCTRIRETAPQASLTIKQRHGNVKGAFDCTGEQIQGSHIAIVDDVMTTGTTINELSRILRDQGAAEVSAWIVARAL